MRRNRPTSKASEILRRRYIDGKPKREASLEAERNEAAIARKVYELRNEAGLTQKDLAEMVDTTQSVISRLEDADYQGRSLSMLRRIADALSVELRVDLISKDSEGENIRYIFQEVLRGLRRGKELGVDVLAKKLDVERSEILAMEHRSDYCPSPITLNKLSKFYNIPLRKLAYLAGAVKDIPQEIETEASRFAAQSESFARLTDEEKRILDDFVKFLRKEG